VKSFKENVWCEDGVFIDEVAASSRLKDMITATPHHRNFQADILQIGAFRPAALPLFRTKFRGRAKMCVRVPVCIWSI